MENAAGNLNTLRKTLIDTSANLCKLIRENPTGASLADMLFLLQLKGQPFSLRDHFFMEPLFSLYFAPRTLAKTCRQVGKTSNMSASELLISNILPYHNTLVVTPRFEQVKRISTQYVRNLINGSPLKSLFIGEGCEQSVLQRSFRNHSTQYYSFAFLDAERIRGISADRCLVDECQDLNWDFIPLIEQSLSGSKWYKRRFAGTPKSTLNTLQKLWESSSQAEWLIRCEGCNRWNIPSVDHDLLKMIGKHTVVCAKCGKNINPRAGLYVHRYPELRETFPGYHISQPITPLYYENPEAPDQPSERWLELRQNQRAYPTAKFYNECLGESYDDDERLLSQQDLRNISLPEFHNELRTAIGRRGNYNRIAFGIDWGGGGDNTGSYTVLTVIGMHPGTHRMDVLYGIRFPAHLSPLQTVRAVTEHIKLFNPTIIAHDYTGAGYTWEGFMIRDGVPADKIAPFSYCLSTARNIITYNKAQKGARSTYQIDKPRSLNVLCMMIKARQVSLPSFESFRPLGEDLLNLYTERSERPGGSDIWLIRKAAGRSDDFAHALNFGCSALWWSIQKYPSLEEALQQRYTLDELRAMGAGNEPLTLNDWNKE